jgi:methanogenic corrinoid protein MtbC1
MATACQQILSELNFAIVNHFITSGIHALENVEPLPETYFSETDPLRKEAMEYLACLLKADRKNARLLVYRLLDTGHSVQHIYESVFQTAQYEIGLLWQTNKISVAHEHYCTAATQVIIAGLYAEIFGSEKRAKTMIGCAVSGELHELGIRMLTDFFELDGWNTYYLGANMPDSNVVTAACDQHADVLTISVTTPFNLNKAETLINKIRSNSSLDKMKIMVGGYAFNLIPDLWKQIGADGYAANARQAVSLAETFTDR